MKPDELKAKAMGHAKDQAAAKLRNLQTQILCCGSMLSMLDLSDSEIERVTNSQTNLLAQYDTAHKEYVQVANEQIEEIEKLFMSAPAVLKSIAETARTQHAEAAAQKTKKDNFTPTNARDREIILREGFWSNGKADTAQFPKAIPRTKPWHGKAEFLEALEFVEARAQKKAYKGWSDCRCCGKKNGSADYRRTRFGVTFVWPSGFSHYVSEHNIRPSLAFQEWVLAASRKAKV